MTDKPLTLDELVLKFTGQYPDVHGRKLTKTWDELRQLMKEDIQRYARECCKATLEKAAENVELKEDGKVLKGVIAVQYFLDKTVHTRDEACIQIDKTSITDPSNITLV